jgi:glucose/arabinose dehydrogenase
MRMFRTNWLTSRFAVLLLLVLPTATCWCADPATNASPSRSIAAIPEPEIALKQFLVAPGLKVQVAASEPLIQNLVSFCFDEKGRIYAVETHRRRTSVFDIRNHPDWLDSDLAFQTVDDRMNFLKKVLVPGNKSLPKQIVQDRNGDGKFDWHDLEIESERIRLLQDKDGDGRMDVAVTFSDDYKTIVSGVAAGVLSRGSKVWFTCIPDLWQLEDTDGDGKADVRKQLFHGFGVHIGLGGHDLHGLCFGPDGKLYFVLEIAGHMWSSRIASLRCLTAEQFSGAIRMGQSSKFMRRGCAIRRS